MLRRVIASGFSAGGGGGGMRLGSPPLLYLLIVLFHLNFFCDRIDFFRVKTLVYLCSSFFSAVIRSAFLDFFSAAKHISRTKKITIKKRSLDHTLNKYMPFWKGFNTVLKASFQTFVKALTNIKNLKNLEIYGMN